MGFNDFTIDNYSKFSGLCYIITVHMNLLYVLSERKATCGAVFLDGRKVGLV